MKVFISYRREDSAAYAGRLRDALSERLGVGNVFHDVSTIGPGEDFELRTEQALGVADATLVVIGPRWLARGPDGASRLARPGDYVRFEVGRALALDRPVVPVLVGGANLPPEPDLPEDLRSLVRRQAFRLRDESWHDDVDGLLRRLSGPASQSRTRPMRLRLVVATLVALVAVASLALFLSGRGRESNGRAPDSVACEEPSEPTWIRLLGPGASDSVTVATLKGSYSYSVTGAFYRAGKTDGRWTVLLQTEMANVDAEENGHASYDYVRLNVDGFPSGEPSCFSTDQPSIVEGERSRALVGFDVDQAPAGVPLKLTVEIETVQGFIDVGTPD